MRGTSACSEPRPARLLGAVRDPPPLRLVRPGQRIVEVGANVGWFSLMFASRVAPSGSVTAFEANPRMVELLRRTLAVNGYAGAVRVVPLAVTDRPSRVTLHRFQRQQGSSSLYAFTPRISAVWDDQAAPLEVEATSLDTFFGPTGRRPTWSRSTPRAPSRRS